MNLATDNLLGSDQEDDLLADDWKTLKVYW